MKRIPSTLLPLLSPDPVLFWAYVLPFLYWAYLILTTNFVMVFDSDGYYYLGHLFYDGQWRQYFQNGPSREPLYPLMIAASMCIGKWAGISYTYPLKIFSFGFLAAAMILIQQALKILKANRWVQAAGILYTGFSPILINSALCMYSEIATFPWLIAVAILSTHFLDSLKPAQFRNLFPAIGLGLCLLGFTFDKGMGEILTPLFLSWLFFYGWRHSDLKIFPFLRQSKSKIFLVLFVFYMPLFFFKSLNYAFNGHFVLTNRAEMTLYGPLTQRAQRPLTTDNLLTHLLTVPISYPLCSSFFPDEKCSPWYASPDETFANLNSQLDAQKLSLTQRKIFIDQSILHALFSHPVRQLVYLLEEGLKMFFWETSQGSFVAYPSWLENLFNIPVIVILMSLGAGCFCICGFLTACALLKNRLILITVVLTSLLIILFGFINIISRYAIIAGPLMVLLNTSCLSVLTNKLFGPSSNKSNVSST